MQFHLIFPAKNISSYMHAQCTQKNKNEHIISGFFFQRLVFFPSVFSNICIVFPTPLLYTPAATSKITSFT